MYHLMTRTEVVHETLVYSPFNHLTRLLDLENFIKYVPPVLKLKNPALLPHSVVVCFL
jgi:hypothetical protein